MTRDEAVRLHNVHVRGSGTTPMVLAHGFGCDQQIWRLVAPAFESTHELVLFDHLGCGGSDLQADDEQRHATLDGYAQDVVWAGQVADVSAQRALQEEAMVLRSAEQARQAQVQFLGRVSHELRTPLNAILGFTQLLTMSAQRGEGAPNLRHLELIDAAGRRLLRLVEDVLDLTRLRSADFEARPVATDLAPLVGACVAMFAPQASRAQVDLSVDVGDDLWVQADAARLGQAIDNLLSNAIKYNRPGGRVQVVAGHCDGGIALDVVDTGIGMTEQQRVAMFQPFNRLGAERSGVAGTGLGLVITAQIVQAMGGRIDVASSPGRGSRFTIWLPSQVQTQMLSATASPSTP